MQKIVSVVQRKGGVGRTTVATTIAAGLSLYGKTTLVDCDPLLISQSWFAARADAGLASDNLALQIYNASSRTSLFDTIPSSDYVVLDGSPNNPDTDRELLGRSDLTLIPIATSIDIWALDDLFDALDDIEKIYPDMDVRLLWNKFRPYTATAQATKAKVKKDSLLKELKTTLGYRQAYMDSAGMGKTAAEYRDPVAKVEAINLVQEVKRILDKK